MVLSKQEQEIHIAKMGDMDLYEVYCSDVKLMRKLDKVSDAYKEDVIDGEVVAKHYRLTLKQILFRLEPKRRELTDEQREVLKERLNKARNSQ